jgi:hypothetical protein
MRIFAGFVVLLGHVAPQEQPRRPAEAGDDDKCGEELDADADEPRPMADLFFEGQGRHGIRHLQILR